jgi:hypothetical protein
MGPPPGPPPPASDLANTLNNVANAAAVTANVVPQIASIFGAGAETVAASVNPVWVSLAKVLGEVSSGFRMTGTVAPGQESFLRVVEHLAQVVGALAINPSDPSLLAEYQEMSTFLAAHPDSQALSAFIATHPAIVPAVAPVLAASAAPPDAALISCAPPPGEAAGWGGLPLYHWHYPPTFAQAPDGSLWPTYESGRQLELVGPSIHRYRASGGMGVDSIAQTLGDVAHAASQSAFGTGYAPVGDASTGWAGPLMGGFVLGSVLGSVYRGWFDAYVSRAAQKARASCAVAGADAAVPVMVNPTWATLAKVLGEVSAGFRLTGVPPESASFLRVVEHLGDVVNGLALSPNDPSLLAEYQELSTFLATHPDSAALAEFIKTHPAIVPVVAPILAAAPTAATGALPPCHPNCPTPAVAAELARQQNLNAPPGYSYFQCIDGDPHRPSPAGLQTCYHHVWQTGPDWASVAQAVAPVLALIPGVGVVAASATEAAASTIKAARH